MKISSGDCIEKSDFAEKWDVESLGQCDDEIKEVQKWQLLLTRNMSLDTEINPMDILKIQFEGSSKCIRVFVSNIERISTEDEEINRKKRLIMTVVSLPGQPCISETGLHGKCQILCSLMSYCNQYANLESFSYNPSVALFKKIISPEASRPHNNTQSQSGKTRKLIILI
jgi:hypothetical protein